MMSLLFEGRDGPWEMVIGLETHAQITSHAKLFSGASAEFGGAPNDHVAFLDAGMPGMLPVINEVCVEAAIKTGIALNAEINLVSIFDRKNYFYPDLPLGYQISQFSDPIVGLGHLDVETETSGHKRIGITRLHLEMDAGKSLHDQDTMRSFIDLNRAGVGLMEIVTEPEIGSADEAAAYVTKLRSILRYLGVCDGNMEEGSLRCDVNISMRRPGAEFGTRAEIKNINSIRFIREAIAYEAERQIEILDYGGEIAQETRLFDSQRGETRSMRSKEESHDYRYFPDPDLPPLVLDAADVARIRAEMPELPDAKRARFVESMGLTAYDADVLAADRQNAAYFETAAEGRDAKIVSNWVTGEVFARLNKEGLDIASAPVPPMELGSLVQMIGDGKISGRQAKEAFEAMWSEGKSAEAVVAEKGLAQISDNDAIQAIVDDIVAANVDKVADYRSGKTKLMGFFVGQVMKASQGKANPQAVNALLKATLESA
jgi:aspartyl-tRNA(Asn)/glutamyl-tRNA(Gln) amidotransferase subunit B